MLENTQIQVFLQLILASFLGAVLGVEREYRRKEAGLRTYSLVSLSAAFFTIIAFKMGDSYLGQAGISFDPARVMGQIVLGVGFLGAGLIIYRQFHVEGLTTAAGLWLVAAVGVAVGTKMYAAAIFVTLLGVAILAGLRILEEKVFDKTTEGNK